MPDPNPPLEPTPVPPTPPTPTPPQNPAPDSGLKRKVRFFDLKSMSPEQRKKFWVIVGASTMLLLFLIGIAVAILIPRPDKEKIEPTPAPATPSPTPTVPIEQASNLDGVVVPYDLSIRHPLAVMIENHPTARPQSGLSAASIIYEAIAEGGITRFMAVYGHTLPKRVGPVRSARPYYVSWAEEYTPNSAYYAHVGGSPDALGKIAGDRVYDLDQFRIGAKAFQRFPKAGVASEHTMYGFPDKLYQVAKDLGYSTESTHKPWQFKSDSDITNRPETQTITIPFSSASYTVKYTYDKASNTYRRYLNNGEHKDAESGRQLAPKNVIVHFTVYSIVDKKGRQNVNSEGEGAAKIFIDGKVIEAKWKKPSSRERTLYTDAATGKEIEFNRGQFIISYPKVGTVITVQ